MTALQSLSLRFSGLILRPALSSIQSSYTVFRPCRSLRLSSSRVTLVDWYLVFALPSPTSRRLLSSNRYDLKLGALARGDCGTDETEGGLAYDVSERLDNMESPVDELQSGPTEGEENESSVDEPKNDLPQRREDTNNFESAAAGTREFGKYAQKNVRPKGGQPRNYLTMSDKELFANCRMDTYRASGPGGQHRNKTDSAVRLTHLPTGLVSQAADDRSQHNNRALALTRMRQVIAAEIRDSVELEGYKPPPELERIIPCGAGGKRGSAQKIGPNHPEFVLGLKALLDLMWELRGSVSATAATLGMSTGAVSKLITSNNVLWQAVNKLRVSKGLKALR